MHYRLAWATQWVPSQLWLQSETLSPHLLFPQKRHKNCLIGFCRKMGNLQFSKELVQVNSCTASRTSIRRQKLENRNLEFIVEINDLGDGLLPRDASSSQMILKYQSWLKLGIYGSLEATQLEESIPISTLVCLTIEKTSTHI